MSKQLDWLQKHKDKINIREAAKQVNMPEATLRKFINGERTLPVKYKDSLVKWVREFRR